MWNKLKTGVSKAYTSVKKTVEENIPDSRRLKVIP
jgi:hypothetical protein